jgi:hypothetical protein
LEDCGADRLFHDKWGAAALLFGSTSVFPAKSCLKGYFFASLEYPCIQLDQGDIRLLSWADHPIGGKSSDVDAVVFSAAS